MQQTSGWRKVLALGMIMISLLAWSAAPEATLFAGPGTTIDGVEAISGTRVFAPARLRTPKGQYSDLILSGASLRLLPGSTQYFGDYLELLEGGVTLKTTSGFKIHSECMTATPQPQPPSRYAVQRLEKTVYVSVQEGSVLVQARRAVQVAPGKTVAVYCGSPRQEIVFTGNNLPAKVLMGTATGAGAATGILIKPNLSSDNPSQR